MAYIFLSMVKEKLELMLFGGASCVYSRYDPLYIHGYGTEI